MCTYSQHRRRCPCARGERSPTAVPTPTCASGGSPPACPRRCTSTSRCQPVRLIQTWCQQTSGNAAQNSRLCGPTCVQRFFVVAHLNSSSFVRILVLAGPDCRRLSCFLLFGFATLLHCEIRRSSHQIREPRGQRRHSQSHN